ncbi:MAG: hypothetical protein QM778_18995 [Myxococcales bacterium]
MATVLAGGALALHVHHYYPYFADDSFISMRYAERLADGLGLTWSSGDRVEGYSNFLWVLLLSLGKTLGFEMLGWARALGVACTAAAMAAILYAHRPSRVQELGPSLFGMLLVAGCGPVACWSIAGLEHPLLIGLLSWALVLSVPFTEADISQQGLRPLYVGCLFALLVWARADAALFLGCAGLVLALCARPSIARVKMLALLAAPAVLALGAQFLFRRLYHDDWLPNTYYAKVAYTVERFSQGYRYVSDSDWLERAPFIVFALGLVAIPFARGARARLLLYWLPCCTWFLYVIAIGGDNMPQRRHLVPFIALSGLIGAELFAWFQRGKRWRGALATLLALGLLWHMASKEEDNPSKRARGRNWVWDGKAIGELLYEGFGADRPVQAQPLLAVDAAGALPYYAKIPALDMLGLNDRFLAHHPPPTFGTGWVGHELGNGDYVMSRLPDLIVFGLPKGQERAAWRGGKEMQARPDFRSRYSLVEFDTHNSERLRALIWTRREGGAVGITRTPGRIRVPGYQLHGRFAVARLRGDHMELWIPRAGKVGTTLALPGGRYRVHVEGDASLTLQVSGAGTSLEGDVLSQSTAGNIKLDISAPSEAPAMLRAVVLDAL